MRVADPAVRELLWNGFDAVVGEMSLLLKRCSFSPLIREMLDFSCGFLDARGRLVADSHLIPAQAGTLEFALAGALARTGPLAEGDVVVTNDPYSGATHLPDLEVFMPVYAGGELLGHVATVAHHVDIGGVSARNRGAVPGHREASRDLYEEGLQLPPVRLVERGRRNDALWDVVLRNVRDPESVEGDLMAQLSACRRGVERLRELAGRHGAATLRAAADDLIDDTSARAAAVLRGWPEGTVTATGFLDGDGLHYDEPLRVHAAVTVGDGRMTVDLSRSAAQTTGTFNVPWSSTYSGLYYALRCFLGPGIRQNHGYMRHVEARAPEGSLFRPRRPAAVMSRHMAVQVLTDVVFRALGELLPDRAVAASHVSFPVLLMHAVDPRDGASRTLMDTVGGGGGARRGAAGDDGIDSYTSNCALMSAEVIELEYPWRVRACALVPGSGGSGTWRGGLAVRRDYELLADRASGRVAAEQRRPEHAARGAAGGGPGAPASAMVSRAGGPWEPLPYDTSSLSVRRGDVVRLTAAGGGGYGPPTAPSAAPSHRADGDEAPRDVEVGLDRRGGLAQRGQQRGAGLGRGAVGGVHGDVDGGDGA
ncbi:hydantoinase B/oxoprolinase family protein [Streptomyces radicis]|uniref:Hydantoinase B/oxoprolinase family protein n=1 Tax=Streptomyces radicis TaxID=1750517 RepID=A0A3A9W0H9_9ACTN|nr:hydantoinase B/oxoprolinase family protein [Streptomyces radicis]RKN17741.1 hydantoinase B/oxoprolinase family protein [Streptomyces radicis]